METIAIVGVGLIGGSFALAMREAGFSGRILGVSSERTIREALAREVIDEGVPLQDACARADLLYLAGPIHSILDLIPCLDPMVRPGTLVTDAGSTKSMIAAAARESLKRGQFIGGHPMAGKESRGVVSAEASIFRGRPYLLTPSDPADLETAPAQEFLHWLQAIGAQPRVMTPEEHDRVVAHSSHLPQLISTALAGMLRNHPDTASIATAAGPGLIDSTRLAMSAWEIWRDILSTNRASITAALNEFEAELRGLRERLHGEGLEDDFHRASDFANHLRNPDHAQDS